MRFDNQFDNEMRMLLEPGQTGIGNENSFQNVIEREEETRDEFTCVI
jgi:GTP-sensing pleiotropic transcriptional regulator CodY